MILVADENIPFAEEAFGPFGDVRLMPGRAISADDVREADALLVRSVTRVTESLIAESTVRFVGTATSGYDHIDRDALAKRGIAFAYAPGSNANSVAEYVASAVSTLELDHGYTVAGKTIGVVGAGNVGRAVLRRVPHLGLRCVIHDPPLGRATCEPVYRPLEDIQSCDIVTLHTPLERDGLDPTYHLVDDAFFDALKPGAVLINAARGPVVDQHALLRALETGRVAHAVLDTWEDEPNVSPELLARCTIGTAHIAGYSYDGKLNGTEALHLALAQFLQRAPCWSPDAVLPAPLQPEIVVDASDPHALARAVRHAYDIMADDIALRAAVAGDGASRGARFDALRKGYATRREFRGYTARLDAPNEALVHALRGLGFQVEA